MNALTTSAAVLSLFFCSAAFSQSKPLSVPSDSGASYSVLEKTGQGNLRTILTKRSGSSGQSFSRREFDCKQELVRYLGTGDTMAEMKSSKPDAKLAPIVQGSIAYYVGKEACSNN